MQTKQAIVETLIECGAQTAFTLRIAQEFGPDGITCNTICPGAILTPRVERFLGECQTPEERARSVASIPVRRQGRVEDVAAAITNEIERALPGLLRPVLQLEVRHALELARVVADQRNAKAERMSGNPQIVVTDGRSCPLQMGTQRAVRFADSNIEFDHRDEFGQP